MPEGRASLAARVLLEAALWAVLVASFLFAYVQWLAAPSDSVVPHLRIVACLALATAALRLVVAGAWGRRPGAGFASSFLLFAMLAFLAFCYGAAVLGIRSWGRVTTWEIIVSYAPQTALLLDAMGIPAWTAAIVPALILVALLAAAWAYGRSLDWVPPAAERLSRTTALAIGFAAFFACAVYLHELLVIPPVREQEPLSLMSFPSQGFERMQSNGVDRAAAARRDAAEDAARKAYAKAAGYQPRNVILIVVDALRADHMALYGYARDTTPNLSRLAAAGQVRMAPAVRTSCSESFCGLLSLASSRFVHQFSTRMFTLQQVFQLHGYRTVMVMGGDHTHFYGLREQYGAVDSYLDASTAGQTYMNDDRFVLDRLAELPRWDGRPVMIQTHLMSAHMLGKRDEAANVFQPFANYYFPTNRIEGGRPAARAVNFYDNGVRQSDTVIAGMLERLEARGYLQDALVAITGDHGEGLGEHGIWAHHVGIYDEVVRVPLVLVDFGRPAGRALRADPSPAQVDIAPTLLEDLGIARPGSWVGKPLQQPAFDEFAYIEQDPVAGLLDRRDPAHQWKYWQDRISGAAFAYDVSTDPGETRNAIGSVPPALLREWQLRMVPVKAQSASGEAFSR